MDSREYDLPEVLGGIIETAMALTGADFGNIQRLGSDGRLIIVAHRGFPDWWVDYWNSAAKGSGVCGAALAKGGRIVVEDVEQSPIFVGTPALEVQRKAGVRAVQSTPLRGSAGQFLGMLSTHYRTPHRPDPKYHQVLDLLAAHAATMLERDGLVRALSLSEERFRLAMDTAEEGIWDWNLATGEVFYSPGYARMLGYDPAEISPQVGSWIGLLHPEEAVSVVEAVRKRLVDPGYFRLEFRLRRKDGSYGWVLGRGRTAVRDAQGNPLRAVGTHLDVTARRLADDAVRESESRLLRAQRAAKVGTWEWDVRTDCNHWCDETFRLYGLAPGAVPPSYEAWLATVSPEERAGVAATVKDSAARGAEFELEWRASGPDGEERRLLSRGHPECDAEGRLIRYLGIVMDITERKHASQALEDIRSGLTEAQKIAHIGSFEFDIGDRSAVWSDEQYRIHGLDAGLPAPGLDEFLDRFVLREDADWLRRNFLDAIAGNQHFDQEHRIVRPDGEVRWVHTLAHPYFDERGAVRRYVGTTMDITERKREESEAQEKNQLMQSLVRQQVALQTAAAIAHELNQPLVSIVAYNEVALRALKSGKPKEETLVHTLSGSHRQALRAGEVLHELIDQLHKGEIEFKPFDINGLVEEVAGKLSRTGFGNFRATLDLQRQMPPVFGNRLQTEKVLLNLIQNGIDAMGEAGVSPAAFAIAVRTLAGHNMAHVTVRDGGPGIDAEAARRIFEPFFSTKSNGLGLGLAISRSLIEAQDGQLWLDPDDGPGAVFHFTLPFANE